MTIAYAHDPNLPVDEFIDLLHRSTLARRRPVDDVPLMEAMLRHAQVVMTARTLEGLLVGISRAITDFHYCTYLSDLAVDQAHQRSGIGKQLIRRTHEMAGLHSHLILLSAPAARDYYPYIGMQPHESCWIQCGTPRE